MRNNGLLVNKWQIISHHPTFASPGIWSQAKEGLNQVGFILWPLRLVCELPVHVIYPQIPQIRLRLIEGSVWPTSQIPGLPLRPKQLERTNQKTPCPSCLDSG